MMLYIIPTIDTEDLVTPFSQGLYKQTLLHDEKTSLLISNLLNKHGIQGTFFVAAAERNVIGDEVVTQLVKDLVDQGHDIGLHTHPTFLRKGAPFFLWNYTKEEQSEFIASEKKFIQSIVGKDVFIHRAGGYGINNDSYDALKENGITIDSSNFYGHPKCKIVVTKNAIKEYKDVLQVPVTTFKTFKNIICGAVRIPYKSRYVKTDINWASIDKLKKYIDFALKKGLSTMNLFLHSYSFLSYDKSYTQFGIKDALLSDFEQLLTYIKKKDNVKFSTYDEVYEKFYNKTLDNNNSNKVPWII